MGRVAGVGEDVGLGVHDGHEAQVEALGAVLGAGEGRAHLERLEARDDADHGLAEGLELGDLGLLDARLELEQDCVAVRGWF